MVFLAGCQGSIWEELPFLAGCWMLLERNHRSLVFMIVLKRSDHSSLVLHRKAKK